MQGESIISDEQLMARFQRDLDASTFAELAGRYLAPGLATARRLLGDATLAEDAVQETLLRLIRSRQRYQPDRPFSTWYYAILRNVCLDFLRRRRTETRAMERLANNREDPAGQAPIEPPYGLELLDRLAPDIRQAVALRVVDGLAFRDVAAALGISLEAAKKRVQRGLRSLRETIADGMSLFPAANRMTDRASE